MNSRTGRLVANPATSWGVEQGLVLVLPWWFFMNSRTGRLVANPATSWGVEQGLVLVTVVVLHEL